MRILLVVLGALAAGCGTPLTRPAAALGGPEGAEAKIIVYRPGNRMADKAYPVYDGESLMGFAEAGGYFEYFCPPGPHLFWISGATAGGVRAELAPGMTYFLQARLEVGFLYLKPRLVPVVEGTEEQATLKDDLARCVCREYTPELAAEYREDRLEEIAERKAWLLSEEGAAECAVLRPADGK